MAHPPWAALLCLLLVLLPFRAASAVGLDRLRSRALALVNEERTGRGLGALRFSTELNGAAQAHADDMLRRGYYAHTSPEGDTVQDRYLDAGGSRWRLVAENIARCTGCEAPATPEEVERLHRGWMNSPGHRENILRRGLDRFGFGLAVGNRTLYAVQTFAGPGLPRGLASGEEPVPLPPEEQAAQAVQAINRARGRAGVPPLRASPVLTGAARVLLPRGDPASARLPPSGDLFDAIPADQRSRWRAVSALMGTCGGCGTAPTQADLRHFRGEWLDDPHHRDVLLDPRMTHLGFAVAADGEGAKTALAVLGTER